MHRFNLGDFALIRVPYGERDLLHMDRRECEIVGELERRDVVDALGREDCQWCYIVQPEQHPRPLCAPPAWLRPLKPPVELSSWDDCVWKPKEVNYA
jgi:hypothetical protein